MNHGPIGQPLHHHARRMSGRDPHEDGRVATPLELLFDLTFATSFSAAAAQFAHALAAGHVTAALIGFMVASFGICWAWTNFSWFSSAYDTDDWLFRVITMIQMIGVLVLATGIARMFASIERGEHLDSGVMVAGYVVMRVAMVFQWLRAAQQNPERRRMCLTYAALITAVQIGWVAMVAANLPFAPTMWLLVALASIELATPFIAERGGSDTPWHAHHIAERHGLFAIIALGEGVVGTIAALSATIDAQGWTLDAALVCTAGLGLTFGMWWVYYTLPSAPILHAHRERAPVWAFGQLLIVVCIVATGAGLHVAGFSIQHHAAISPVGALLAVAIPVGVFLAIIYALYAFLVQRFDRLHIILLVGTALVTAAAIAAATRGVDLAICLIILMFAPVVTIVGYEWFGHRHQYKALESEA